jgi:hypothetical protein
MKNAVLQGKNNLGMKYTRCSADGLMVALLDKQKAMDIDYEFFKVLPEFNFVLSLGVERNVQCKVSEGFGKSLSHHMVLLRVEQPLN